MPVIPEISALDKGSGYALARQWTALTAVDNFNDADILNPNCCSECNIYF
ncbi:hypothetical protein FMIA91_08230 [Fidelibacter multiformis]